MGKLKTSSRVLIFICSLIMIPSLYFPLWKIELEAPQYPEGLKMEIWSNRIAGDINNINGLNHYIGMALIKDENFPELKIIPFVIYGLIGLGIVTALFGRRFLLWVHLSTLTLSGIVGMYDFWKWEYEYGNNLDPHAAIKIPGMSYQPPLIGWKQLLNFTAGSFPDIGSWLIIGPSVILIAILYFEYYPFRK